MSCLRFFNQIMLFSFSFLFISCGPGFLESLDVNSKKTKDGTRVNISAGLSLPNDLVLEEQTFTVTHPHTNTEVGTVQMSGQNVAVNVNVWNMTGVPEDEFTLTGNNPSVDFGTPSKVISVPFERGLLHLLNKSNENGKDELMIGITLNIDDPSDPLLSLRVEEDDAYRDLFDSNIEDMPFLTSVSKTFSFMIKKNAFKKYRGFQGGSLTFEDGIVNGSVFFLINANRIIKKENFADLAVSVSNEATDTEEGDVQESEPEMIEESTPENGEDNVEEVETEEDESQNTPEETKEQQE